MRINCITVEVLYIDNNGKQIYCVYHEPVINTNAVGVILCNPLGQESIRCHGIYKKLAESLAAKGVHVMRFDYYGTGDSMGDDNNFTISDLEDDIKCVIDNLKNGCELNRIVLIGARFGGYLALKVGLEYGIDKIVPWCPVINGKDYLNELKHEYQKWLQGSFIKESKTGIEGIESFGFHYPEQLINQIKSISITTETISSNIPILLLDEPKKVILNTENCLYQEIINKNFWLKLDAEREKKLIPLQEIEKIIKWI